MTPNGPFQPVLLIESDPAARAALATILRARHEVETVESGADAIAHLSKGELPCLILFVLRHGDDSGSFRTAQQAEPSWARIPIVLFSAQADSPSAAFIDTLFVLTGRHCETVQ